MTIDINEMKHYKHWFRISAIAAKFNKGFRKKMQSFMTRSSKERKGIPE
jgi:hypothetical protein